MVMNTDYRMISDQPPKCRSENFRRKMKSCPIKTKYVPLQDMECCTVCVSLCVQSRLTLCDPMDYSPPGSSVHGISQARILECVAISSSRGSFQPRDQTQFSCIADRFFTIWATREAPIYKNNYALRLSEVYSPDTRLAQYLKINVIQLSTDFKTKNILSFQMIYKKCLTKLNICSW